MDNRYISERIMNRQISLLESVSSQYNDNIIQYNRNMSNILTRIDNLINRPVLAPTPEPNITMDAYARIFTYLLRPAQTDTPQLTQTEIGRTTHTYVFTEDNQNQTDNQCPISLEFFQTGDILCSITGCGHKFKRNALMEWFRHNSNCPVCRYNLRTPITDMSNNPISNTSLNEDEEEEEFIFDSSVD